MMRRLLHWLIALWRSPPVQPHPSCHSERNAAVCIQEIAPSNSGDDPKPTTRDPPQQHSLNVASPSPTSHPAVVAANAGLFHFRETILEKLDDYMHYVGRMKAADRESYDLYSKIGASIVPDRAVNREDDEPLALSPWFREQMPSFGAIACGVSPALENYEKQHDMVTPRFIYFRKYKRVPAGIQRPNAGQVYCVTAYFDMKNDSKMKRGVPVEWPVAVTPDGSVRLLLQRLPTDQLIHHRSGPSRGRVTTVQHQRWGVSPFVLDWAKENNVDPQSMLTKMFIRSVNAMLAANSSMIRVAASKGKTTAVFGVDVLRTPYFFADRDAVLGEEGVKKRIFHIVRVHQRRRRDGSRQAIRTHFRGVRRFRWNGYDMHISVPSLHHADPLTFRGGATDEIDAIPGEQYLNTAQMGDFLADHIKAGFPAARH